MTSLGFLSKDGKSFTFDARANGYGRGEGAGIVVLKTLQKAIQDNDTIRAVIRGSASNQDGRTPGKFPRLNIAISSLINGGGKDSLFQTRMHRFNAW